MQRALAMAMMTMRRNNPCGGNNNARMATRINPSCTWMTTSNEHSGSDNDQGE
jgi:hypothetical protein